MKTVDLITLKVENNKHQVTAKKKLLLLCFIHILIFLRWASCNLGIRNEQNRSLSKKDNKQERPETLMT